MEALMAQRRCRIELSLEDKGCGEENAGRRTFQAEGLKGLKDRKNILLLKKIPPTEPLIFPPRLK